MENESIFITDNDVLNNISDDMIYIRELVKREKIKDPNFLNIAHLGRLVTVFSYNCIEAHRDFLARSIGATSKTISWEHFFDRTELSPIFLRLIKSNTMQFSSVDEARSTLSALQALRNFISHGLVDGSAMNFEKKMKSLEKANLKINPKQFTIAEIDRLLEFEQKVTNLFGMSKAIWTSEKNGSI